MIVIAVPRRRWLQFSLRTAFVLLTIGCIWLGILAERARQQREAVEAIEALGGSVTYDFQIVGVPYDGNPDPPHTVNRIFRPDADPPGPIWLRRLIGDEFFQEVVAVTFMLPAFSPPTESEIQRAIPHLKRLRSLKRVAYWPDISDETHRELKDALPSSALVHIGASFSY